MACRSRLWLGIALACSACVVGQGHGAERRESGPSSTQPSASAGAGTMAVTGSGSGGRAAQSSASGNDGAAASTDSSGTGGAELNSGARGENPSSGKQDGGAAADRDAATTHDSGAASDSDAECARAAVDVCNPVTNEGCLDSLSMQCAVDYASHLTGYCIFYSGQSPTPGVDCLNTGVTESCPPTSACVDGQCRELCLCNADCEAGTCCTQRLEDTGFKVCGAC
jgi:hypothetical protein